jgi:hypothetical protein
MYNLKTNVMEHLKIESLTLGNNLKWINSKSITCYLNKDDAIWIDVNNKVVIDSNKYGRVFKGTFDELLEKLNRK